VHLKTPGPPTTGTTIFYGCHALNFEVPSRYKKDYSSWTAKYLGITGNTED
jgi:hypothetical protein